MKIIKYLFKIIISVCIVCALFVGITNGIVVLSANKDIVSVEEAADSKAECIVVLGCSVHADGTPSLMLKDRLDKAVELYKAGAAPKILMSGDHVGRYYNEVAVMKKYAISCGVPSEDIFLDHYGLSTYETMYRSDAIFQLKNIIVVTQEYHLYRSVYNAKAFGINAKGVSAEKISYSNQLIRDVREIAARTKDWIYCILKPEPTKLGDVIPVVGNGDVTNERE